MELAILLLLLIAAALLISGLLRALFLAYERTRRGQEEILLQVDAGPDGGTPVVRLLEGPGSYILRVGDKEVILPKSTEGITQVVRYVDPGSTVYLDPALMVVAPVLTAAGLKLLFDE